MNPSSILIWSPSRPAPWKIGQVHIFVEHQVEALGLEGEVRRVFPLDAAADDRRRSPKCPCCRDRSTVPFRLCRSDAELAFHESGTASKVIEHIVSDPAGPGARGRQESRRRAP